ncbi:flagellin, partial [Blastococcus sp. CT_GayMR20]
LKVAVRNTQDGISVVQTAEGALTETHSILQRMRDLSVQASNEGGLNTEAKKNIQSEISQLKSELNRIANTTTFNGKKLLDSSFTANFQVGSNAGETISVGIATAMNASGLNVAGVDVTAPATGSTNGNTVNASAGTPGTFTTNVGDFTTAAAFDTLTGTITVGDKSIDLASIKHGAADTVATRLATVNTAVNNALGTAN